jgi:tetratricopeptide (TPR) repeat protein
MKTLWTWPLFLPLFFGCAGLNRPAVRNQNAADTHKQRAAEVARSLDERRDDAEFRAALARWGEGDAEECERGLARLLKREPNHRDARLLLAEVCMATKRPQEAFAHVQQALDAHPNDAEVQYTTGLLLDATGQGTGASAYYARAAELEPGSEVYAVSHTAPGGPAAAVDSAALAGAAGSASLSAGTDSAGATSEDAVSGLLPRGQQALAEGSPQTATLYFQKAISLRPDDPQVPISAAVAALREDQPAVAVELLTVAAKQFPKSAAIHRTLGAAHYRQGDYRASQVALQQALSLDKSSPLTYLLMGCTLRRLGQIEAAESHLRQAQTMDPRYTLRR